MRKIIQAALLMLIAVLAYLNLTVHTGPEPDAVYPMTNQHIEWHYAGK